jgi:hypothetical protein
LVRTRQRLRATWSGIPLNEFPVYSLPSEQYESQDDEPQFICIPNVPLFDPDPRCSQSCLDLGRFLAFYAPNVNITTIVPMEWKRKHLPNAAVQAFL